MAADEHATTEPRLARNSAVSLAGNVWSALLGIATLPLLVAGLGQTAFGVWALLQTFSATTGWFSLADLGVGAALARETAQRRATGANSSALPATGLWVMAALGVVLSVAFAGIALAFFDDVFSVPTELRSATKLAIIGSSIQIAADLLARGIQAVAEGEGRLDLGRSFDVVRRTLVAATAAAVAVFDGDLGHVASGAAAASLLGLAITWRSLGRRFIRSLSFDRDEALHLFRAGRSFALLNSVGVLHRTMDRIITGVVLGPATAALIEVAGQVQMGITSIVVAGSYATMSSTPYVAARQGLRGTRELVVRATRWCLYLSAPLVGIVLVLADPLVVVWVDIDAASLPTLVRLAVTYVAVSMLTAVSAYALQGLGKASALIRPSVIAVAINLSLSIFLANALGAEGVYVATIVAAAGLVVAILLAVRQVLQLQTTELFHRAFVPGLVLGAAAAVGAAAGYVLATPWATLLVGSITGAVVSIGLAAIVLPGEDRSVLRRGMRRTRKAVAWGSSPGAVPADDRTNRPSDDSQIEG